jgi:hypothetical protein
MRWPNSSRSPRRISTGGPWSARSKARRSNSRPPPSSRCLRRNFENGDCEPPAGHLHTPDRNNLSKTRFTCETALHGVFKPRTSMSADSQNRGSIPSSMKAGRHGIRGPHASVQRRRKNLGSLIHPSVRVDTEFQGRTQRCKAVCKTVQTQSHRWSALCTTFGATLRRPSPWKLFSFRSQAVLAGLLWSVPTGWPAILPMGRKPTRRGRAFRR